MMASTFLAKYRCLILLLAFLHWATPAWSDELPEYQVKAALIYNFIAFTEWPSAQGDVINLCVYGANPFGTALDKLQGTKMGRRVLALRQTNTVSVLENCQFVFVARQVNGNLSRVLDNLSGKPTLIVSDVLGGARDGATFSFVIEDGRIQFEVNVGAAETRGLLLSSKMLRLAKQVYR